MTDSRSLSYANQDLRHRSFKRQVLHGADFSGADLRGCNFDGAELVGANFEQAKMGQTRRQRAVRLLLAIVTFLVVGHAVSSLVFGSLGQTPADKAWTYVIVLTLSLAIAGAAAGLKLPLKAVSNGSIVSIASMVSSIASGAVTGFFYAGILTNKNPRWAIVGAVVGAALGGILGWRWSQPPVTLIISTAGAIAAYGFAFLIGTTALSLLNVGYIAAGMLTSLLALLYLWFTLNALKWLVQTLHQAPGTSFRHANLTHAQFSPSNLHQIDVSHAVGWAAPAKNANFLDQL